MHESWPNLAPQRTRPDTCTVGAGGVKDRPVLRFWSWVFGLWLLVLGVGPDFAEWRRMSPEADVDLDFSLDNYSKCSYYQ